MIWISPVSSISDRDFCTLYPTPFIQQSLCSGPEFDRRRVASDNFPPIISTFVIRSCISNYELVMSTGADKAICASWSQLVASSDVSSIPGDEDRLRSVNRQHLDICGRQDYRAVCNSNSHLLNVGRSIVTIRQRNKMPVSRCTH
jgi:hypothetical protein